jgi:hypothetical protein
MASPRNSSYESGRSKRFRRTAQNAPQIQPTTISVGFSRAYLGVHYPTDIVVGWICGAFWAVLLNRFDRPDS